MLKETAYMSHYLPYGLNLKSDNKTLELIGIQGDLVLLNDNSNCVSSMSNEFYWKPLLRPISQLTEEIEHNGEKFMPIRVLYNMARISHQNHVEKEEFIKAWGGNYILRVYASDDYYSEFVYGNDCFSYRFVDLKHNYSGDNPIRNQLSLFNKLFEWHFDVFGLIEHDLAIAI